MGKARRCAAPIGAKSHSRVMPSPNLIGLIPVVTPTGHGVMSKLGAASESPKEAEALLKRLFCSFLSLGNVLRM